jgi:hypothetical protein
MLRRRAKNGQHAGPEFWGCSTFARTNCGGIREIEAHQSLNGATPGEKGGGCTVAAVSLEHYDWQRHCHNLFRLPITA